MLIFTSSSGTCAVQFPRVSMVGCFVKHLPEIFPAFVVAPAVFDHICRESTWRLFSL